MYAKWLKIYIQMHLIITDISCNYAKDEYFFP